MIVEGKEVLCIRRWVFITQHLFFHITFLLLWSIGPPATSAHYHKQLNSFILEFSYNFWNDYHSTHSNFLVCILCNLSHSHFSFREILCCVSHLPWLPLPKKSFQVLPLLTSKKIINFAPLPCACPLCICLTSNSVFWHTTKSWNVWGWMVSHPTLCSKQDQLEQVAHGHVMK